MRQNAFYARRFRRAFTLVELLTVVIIIGIMATISVSVLTGAMQSARESKTRATIKRIDTAILEIFESYEERYNEIAAMNFDDDKVRDAFDLAAAVPVTDGHRAAIRLHMIRDLMRMEMPCSWAEVFDSTNGGTPKAKQGSIPFKAHDDSVTVFAIPEPAVLGYYYRAYTDYIQRLVDAGADADTRTKAVQNGPGRAALLYLVVANLNPEALEFFQASEIADTDGDGLLEFVDAWGRPIQFLRWAPAFPDSEVQSDVLTGSGHTVGTGDDPEDVWKGGPASVTQTNWDAIDLGDTAQPASLPREFKRAFERNSDPFDRYGVQRAWFLYPVIYSAGPDGIYDIASEEADATSKTPVSPKVSNVDGLSHGMLDPFAYPIGYPIDSDGNGVLNHYDNITNHQR